MRFLPNTTTYTSHQTGQVLLVIVLLIVVVMSIGLSLVTRSLTNVRQTVEEDESQRAFSAAEAGIQEALERDQGETRDDFSEGSGYSTIVRRIEGDDVTINQGNVVPDNESVDIWLSTYQSGPSPSYTNLWTGTLVVYWGERAQSGCQDAALAISVISGPVATPVMRQYAVDPCNAGRRTRNAFSAPTDRGNFTVEGKQYNYRYNIPVTNGVLARVMPLYDDTAVAAGISSGNPPLPLQGRVIESTGSSGETQRKIVVVQGNPKLPLEIFPYVLFTADSR